MLNVPPFPLSAFPILVFSLQPFLVGRVPTHGVPGWRLAVGCWALNVPHFSISVFQLFPAAPPIRVNSRNSRKKVLAFAAIDLRRSGWALNLET
jgi:hypothetical protein